MRKAVDHEARVYNDGLAAINAKLLRLEAQAKKGSPGAQEKLIALIEKLDAEIADQSTFLIKLQKTNVSFEAANNAAAEVEQRIGPQVLAGCIENALSISKEWQYQPLAERLLGIVNIPGLIQIVINEKNPIRSQVIIYMDKYAGNQMEWARAVMQVRTMDLSPLAPKRPQSLTKPPPDWLESKFWREKIYGVAREGVEIWAKGGDSSWVNPKNNQTYYRHTPAKHRTDKEEAYKELYDAIIKARLSFCSKPAPFWSLLDRGSVSFPIGKDPYGYPVGPRTNFLNIAMGKIREQFISMFNDMKMVYEAEKADKIADIKLYINQLREAIKRFRGIEVAPPEEKIVEMRRWEEKVFTKKELNKIDKTALAQLEYDLINMRVETFNADMRRRLGGGVRVRYKRILQRLQKMNGK